MDLKKKLSAVNEVVQTIGNEKLITMSKFLKDRIDNSDYYVVLAGETSSGKSTLINGLLQKYVLYSSPAPSTGAIAEVCFSDVNENEYYAINKDATMEIVDYPMFVSLSKKPDSDLQRLRLCTFSLQHATRGMRIFDTPGYDSIIAEHDEVLKNFLPNSDVIIYTVGYRVGFQNEDFQFLRYLNELIRDDAEIILAINMCPQGTNDSDIRIAEIKKYVFDLLHKNIPCVLIPKVPLEPSCGKPLPKSEQLWSKVSSFRNSEEFKNRMQQAFDSYIDDLYAECEQIVHHQEILLHSTEEEKEDLKQMQADYQKQIESVINEIVIPGFDALMKRIPQRIDIAATEIKSALIRTIETESTVKMEETITFINAHKLPLETEQQTKELMYYIQNEIEIINKKADERVNGAVEKLQYDISIRYASSFETAAKNSAKSFAVKLGTNGLTKYFAAFGGAGGSGAGVANAASHLLKKAGDLVGKTFSRETHNSLKHVLAKVGATSAKAVSIAVSVVMELLTLVVEYSTWKAKLKSKVSKGVEEWKKTMLDAVLTDISSLRTSNIDTLNGMCDEIDFLFDCDDSIDEKQIKKNIGALMKCRKQVYDE